ncbi:hypothetical protein GCM10020358_71700 [Amorphoplanes nipponensis]|uniref:Uncharacterized protein n=1 Tax=Actinoplanes nipponensis TaxID=135950 RepID=A0A919JCF9_9ACTN|nr:hypothetical protein [Actinoplanes nipponensis]GIE47042.1 hypothetical protein Ani05nite_05760 [Actinoplanes nipponensis]
MDANGEHHVARIDDTVTAANLHERAEAVAVPDFNYLEQTIEAVVNGLTGRSRRARRREGDTGAAADAQRRNP